MNGVHDMGGAQGYGSVWREPNEPVFHADWERQAMGLTVLMGACGQWNIDQARSTRESLPPALYLTSSYYQIWIEALERLMLARGLVQPEELRAGEMLTPAVAVRQLAADQVDAAMARGTSAERPVLIDRFLEDAFEFDVDAVADGTGAVVIGGIMEHIEEAGIHSGDSSCVVPPFMVAEKHLATIREYTRRIARAQGFHDGMMLLMREREQAKSALQIFCVEGDGGGRGKGHNVAARDKIIQQYVEK